MLDVERFQRVGELTVADRSFTDEELVEASATIANIIAFFTAKGDRTIATGLIMDKYNIDRMIFARSMKGK